MTLRSLKKQKKDIPGMSFFRAFDLSAASVTAVRPLVSLATTEAFSGMTAVPLRIAFHCARGTFPCLLEDADRVEHDAKPLVEGRAVLREE